MLLQVGFCSADSAAAAAISSSEFKMFQQGLKFFAPGLKLDLKQAALVLKHSSVGCAIIYH
jgi:hypothetical protein